MKYVDANILIYAMVDMDEKGKKAKEFLVQEFSAGKKIASSTLSFDEITWVVQKKLDRKSALRIARDLITDARIHWISATPEIIKISLEVMERYGLDPRDAIHAASCHSINGDTFVSEDAELNSVPFLHCINPLKR